MTKPIEGQDTQGNTQHRRLPVASLHIDMSYQRTLSDKRVYVIAKDFDVDKLGELAVSSRNGTYYLIDGQHRLQAAKQRLLTHVPCRVYSGLTVKEEAELRLAFNCRRSDTSMEVFKLKLAMNDPIATAIYSIVDEAGLEIVFTTHGGNPLHVRCVGTLERIYTRYRSGADLLAHTLDVSYRVWPNDYMGRSGLVLEGLALFLHYYPEVTDTELITKLSHHTPRSLLGGLRTEKVLAFGVGVPRLFGRLVLRAYNYQKRNKLPERFVELRR